jgi:undecaprenyl-diphosphatase
MSEQWIELVKYAFLGLLQGVTEPIPVSSSGHLVIAERLLGLHIEGLSFEVLVNFASLLAVLAIYHRDLIRIALNGWLYLIRREPEAKPDFRFILLLVVATIPAAVAGALFEDVLGDAFKGMKAIGITLLITGVALWLIRKLQGSKQDRDIRLREAVIIGLAQALALIPGISRSGATIVAGMGVGLKRETALRFSFLLYIPVSVGSMMLSAADLARDPELDRLLLPYAAAFVLSLIASYFALRWFMGIMARGNLRYFSYYCWIAGLLVLIFL